MKNNLIPFVTALSLLLSGCAPLPTQKPQLYKIIVRTPRIEVINITGDHSHHTKANAKNAYEDININDDKVSITTSLCKWNGEIKRSLKILSKCGVSIQTERIKSMPRMMAL